MANNANPCVHQLRAELHHSKKTNEEFSINTSTALPFAHAFSATSICVPHVSGQTLVQVVLTSTAGGPISILDYSISGATVVHDPNGVNIKSATILPNQRISFVFCLSLDDEKKASDSQKDIILQLSFSLRSAVPDAKGNNSSTSVHSFSTPISLLVPSPQYVIETRNPPTAFFAQPIQFELLISQTPNNTQSEIEGEKRGALLFEIEEDPLWIICGRRRASIHITPNTPATVACRIRPVTAGIIPIPKVRLCGIPPSNFVVTPKGPPHIQVFPEPITSECVSTVVDDRTLM